MRSFGDRTAPRAITPGDRRKKAFLYSAYIFGLIIIGAAIVNIINPLYLIGIVVGGGAAGLTAGAYLSKYGFSTLLLEKENHCGGLINSFERNGMFFDGGIRALENAGALFPMLKQLGINIDFIKNRVSVGIEDEVFEVEPGKNFQNYQKLLTIFYPNSKNEIAAIVSEIKKITKLMDIQYGIDNPIFLDIKDDREYFIKEVFPWMFKYLFNIPKVSSRNQPVLQYLKKFTTNQSLLDIITQHFFTDTPAYFALSYFRLYQDYYYPKRGTGEFSQKLADFIVNNGGEIRTNTKVQYLDLDQKVLRTENGDEIIYEQLLWAADQKTLYQIIDTGHQAEQEVIKAVHNQQSFLNEKTGNDSVLTLFLSVNLDHSYFNDISTGHFFYTPSRKGLSGAGSTPYNKPWDEVEKWLDQFLELTTYEISIPALRDDSLAPPGKTGLIISTLFDYKITKVIYDHGWGELFQNYVTVKMIETLERSIYPGLQKAVFDSFIASPLTLQKITGNSDGAITGWSFTNHPMPAESRLIRISNAVKTPLNDVTQAGQWTYSPSGFPVSLITGKLAADRVKKNLKGSI